MNNLINEQILEKLAVLAKIKINKKNEKKFLIDLEKILDHFKELQNIDVKNIKPFNREADLVNIYRNDEIININKKNFNDDLIGQFPEKESGFLKVPPVFE